LKLKLPNIGSIKAGFLQCILFGDVARVATASCSVGQEDLKTLHCELHPISDKWYSLGIQLQVPVGILRCIRRDYLTVSERLLEMLTSWLKCTNPQPSLEALAEALESAPVAEKSLAKQLREKELPRKRGNNNPHLHSPKSIIHWCSLHLPR